jgi:hypothetical protein
MLCGFLVITVRRVLGLQIEEMITGYGSLQSLTANEGWSSNFGVGRRIFNFLTAVVVYYEFVRKVREENVLFGLEWGFVKLL